MKFLLLVSLVFLAGNDRSSHGLEDQKCNMCLNKAFTCLDGNNCFGEMMVLQNEFGISYEKLSDQAIRGDEKSPPFTPHVQHQKEEKLRECTSDLKKSQIKVENMDKVLTDERKTTINLANEFSTCQQQLKKVEKLLEEANYFANMTHQLSHLSLNAHHMISNASKKASNTIPTLENLDQHNGSSSTTEPTPLNMSETKLMALIVALTTTCGLSLCCHSIQLLMWVRAKQHGREKAEKKKSPVPTENAASGEEGESGKNDETRSNETNV